ncbi:MAG: transposase [Synergistaceae bacterium]
MKLTNTAKLVIDCSPDEFKSTIRHYTNAYNFVCNVGFKSSNGICTNGVTLHHKVYEECRKNLPAQLAISARMKATESLKSVQARIKRGKKATCPKSKSTAIRYDKNSYTLWLNKNIVSISTCEGRKKFNLVIPKYFEKYLTWKYTSADLFVRDGKVFLHVVFEKEISDVKPNNTFVGIDRGINQLAVTSQNKFYDGRKIKRISQKYGKTRSELQSKGHQGKRHLKKLKSKEQRFRRDVNHTITKQIVNSIDSGSTIVLENLKGIRNAKARKEQRKELNKWNFFQFEQFLTYKAMAKGIRVEYVSAKYTSQKCSGCGEIRKSNRKFQSLYFCNVCHLSLNADLNASRNIVQNYLDSISYPSMVSVNMPYAPSSEVEQAPTPLG